MREIPLSVEPRSEIGKGFARRTRMAGRIPGVVYGPGIEPQPVSVEERAFRAAMRQATSSTILSLMVGSKESKALVRDMQRDPITNRVLHIDFHAIAMDRPINVWIPIHLKGTPMGVKVEGGIMQTTMRELEISCLPANIPDSIDLDVSELGIGDSIHVGDLKMENVDVLAAARQTIVVISAPTVIKAETVAGEGVLAEGEAAVAAEGAEGAEEAEGEDEPEKKEKGKSD